MENETNYCEGVNFNGSEVLSVTVQKCINKIIEKENIKSYYVDVKDVSTNGGNYLGSLQTVDIKGKGIDATKEVNLFLKNINLVEDFSYFSMKEVYLRESFMYIELFEIYGKLQEEYNIPKEERYNIVKSYSDINSEVIILENLSKKGFETVNRRDVISLEFAELAIVQMARYHGLSFVLQQKKTKYFDKNIKNMKHLFNFTPEWMLIMKKIYDLAADSLEGEAKAKLNNFYPLFVTKYKEYFRTPEEQAVCLCHGDFRANNVMLKKVDGALSEVSVIDFQFVSYNTPVLDFIYFIFGGSDQLFRDKHMEHLKDLYYDSLEIFLEKFGVKAEEVYSRQRFEKEFREKLDFGLMSFVVLMPFLFTTEDDVPDINDMDKMAFKLSGEYKVRIREIVDYFIQEGYL